ncbi:MAG: DNA primase [Burkholderiaceae bacterium]
MIPQSFIQELLARVDIVEVVGRHVKLRKAGANWLGLCPFHGEKSPSFTVSATKQFYHCFGCGAHGSAIGFLMEQAGLGYVDAIHDLARNAGLQVPSAGPGEDTSRQTPGVLEVLETAARFYKARLKDSERAVEYLKGRGLSGPTAARFGIGYAPEGWRGLQAAVGDYFAKELLDAGLVIEPEQQEEGAPTRRYDRFRDRIMFPIRNPRGQVIGFGGRVIGSGEPKYLNSPETVVFSKGRELYGLFEGRDAIRSEDCVVVVEGYMDVVMLAQHGIHNAVATLGTATTPQHVAKLLRLVERVVFAFDGDAAGRRAAWRALESCLPQLADTRRIDFLFLPPEHDPDSFVREQGAQGWAQALEKAIPLSEFFLTELSGQVDLASPEGRARLQALARPLVQSIPPIALRLQIIQAIATRAGVGTSDFSAFVAQGERTGGSAQKGARAFPQAGEGRRADARPSEARGAAGFARFTGPLAAGQRPDLIQRIRLLLSLHPELARESVDISFLPEALAEWIAWVCGLPEGTRFAGLIEALRADRPEEADRLQALALRDRGLIGDLAPADALSELRDALWQLRLQSIRAEIDRLAASGLPDETSRSRYAELQGLLRTGR